MGVKSRKILKLVKKFLIILKEELVWCKKCIFTREEENYRHSKFTSLIEAQKKLTSAFKATQAELSARLAEDITD